jgi:hypothetical protein
MWTARRVLIGNKDVMVEYSLHLYVEASGKFLYSMTVQQWVLCSLVNTRSGLHCKVIVTERRLNKRVIIYLSL